MAKLKDQIQALDVSLDAFNPTDNASWAIATIFNTLLAQAKLDHANEAVVQAMVPAVQASMKGRSTMDVGTVRASLGQLLAVS